jgi:hypothetical protein
MMPSPGSEDDLPQTLALGTASGVKPSKPYPKFGYAMIIYDTLNSMIIYDMIN